MKILMMKILMMKTEMAKQHGFCRRSAQMVHGRHTKIAMS